jgi:multicomponent Na+:H+ antiporter subunit D
VSWSTLVPVPIVLPLLGAALSILLGRSKQAQRAIALVVLVVTSAIAVALLVRVDRSGPLLARAGGWPAPMGIMLLAVLTYAIGQPGAERHHVGFQSVYLVLAAGIAMAFLTGDLFNLFVAFEVVLTASYVLITMGGRREQVRAGMSYVVISLVASALFVTALALLYAATGTVNMADLATKVPELPAGVRHGLSVLLLVVFGIKAGLFPLCSWLPDSYPTAPSPVTAIFAGLLTKVGVYALLRTQTLLVPEGDRMGTLLLWVATATMVVGVLGAIAQDDVKRILSFHIISHVGTMVMGLGLFTVAGLAGGIWYAVHHIVAMTTLFLVGGLIEHQGRSTRLDHLGGMLRSAPGTAVLFLIPALSLAGIPPLSGFVAKLAVVQAGLARGEHLAVAATLVVGLLTLFSMAKIWAAVFWHPAPEPAMAGAAAAGVAGPGATTVRAVAPVRAPRLMVVPTVALVVLGLGIAAFAGPLYDLSERTATDLLAPQPYVDAVLGRQP